MENQKQPRSKRFEFWFKDTSFNPWSLPVQQSHWTESQRFIRWEDETAHPAWNKTLSGSWCLYFCRLHFQAGMQRRRPKQVDPLSVESFFALSVFQKALSQTWLKTRGPGIWFTLEIIGSKFQQQVFCCWCGIYCNHLPMRIVSHQHHVRSAHDRWVSVSSIKGDFERDVSGQVHKCLQTMRSHVNCCVRFRVSSFIRPSAEVSCRNVNMISICSVLRHPKQKQMILQRKQ